MTENSAKQPEELNSNKHWVETLFPPRFTFQDLLRDRDDDVEILSSAFRPSDLPSERAESRRQIYISTLREIQLSEEKTRRENLEKRISRKDEQPSDRLRPQGASRPQDGMVDSECNKKASEEERNTWNEKDITMLRRAVADIERDRWRLREQLKSCDEQLKQEQQERRRLQELLEQREGQLDLSRKEAARCGLEVKVLRTHAQKMTVQLQRLSTERQEVAEEANRLRTELRKGKDSLLSSLNN